jgi:hypothetical protein
VRAFINDYVRACLGWVISALGLMSNALQPLRISHFKTSQKRLKHRYGVTAGTPIASYGPAIEQSIRARAREQGHNSKFARTSGSTGKPKQLLYTPRRLRLLKLTFSDMFMRACNAFQIKRTSLYVFSSFEADASLTSLLLEEGKLPNCLTTLQAPYRLQHHPAISELVAEYGSVAVRLWILTISNPGVLYATNPSTISTFLDELANNWQRSSRMIRDWCIRPTLFSSNVHRIAGRLESRGFAERLSQVALSTKPLSLSRWAPAVEAYICWTGGYVKPFLDRLATHLPSPRYTLIPMYSMSTESIETLPYFRHRDVAFLPTAAGVVYEFVNEVGNVFDAEQLQPGELYAMIVSDSYGLQRYQTDDLFLCKRKVHGLPDLDFVRRRTLEHSFTGEKLTAEQLSLVFDQLHATYRALLADTFLTCVPAQPPHYKVLIIGETNMTLNDHAMLAARCDEMLCEINCEYSSKRASGRLGAIEIEPCGFKEFVSTHPAWETQFKFLPLHVLI